LAAVEGAGQSLKTALSKHAVTVVRKLGEAYRCLDSEQFDLIVCDVCFDDSQMFDLWSTVRRRGLRVPFLAYRERESELGGSMELIVKKAVFNMGLDGYLDLRELALPDRDLAVLVDFIELGLASGKLKSERINDHLLVGLGTTVKSRRLKLGLSLEGLAKASGLEIKLLRALESGKQKDLELDQLRKLAFALDVTASKLLEDAEEA
jgi:DNA-binding Xre family transcriptional regulator/CheY-like chemotaxis protein